jgi:hypothetical protein
MCHTNEHIIRHKVGLLYLAEKLGNVSKACQIKSRVLHHILFFLPLMYRGIAFVFPMPASFALFTIS